MTISIQTNYQDFVARRTSLDWRIKNVEMALEHIREGRLVLIIDEEIEGEGDVCVAAEKTTPEIINFMVTECRGLVCQSITPAMARQLELPLMVPTGVSPAFTITADAATCGSGTSAYDRAKTVRAIADPATEPGDLVRPGHIFPLVARPGGVLERGGHTEASHDLARLAGFVPSAVICEVMTLDGDMARPKELLDFARHHQIHTLTTRDLIEFRVHCDNYSPPVNNSWQELMQGGYPV